MMLKENCFQTYIPPKMSGEGAGRKGEGIEEKDGGWKERRGGCYLSTIASLCPQGRVSVLSFNRNLLSS